MNSARLVFPALRWSERGPDEVWPEVRRAIDAGVGGFVVFGGSVGKMRELVARAREHANRPLLFAADLERGTGQQLREATSLPPAAALAGLADTELLEAARITAQEAALAGIGWVLAPVADLDLEPENPIVGTRSFGASAAAVSDLVRSWVLAAQAEGVNACAKHFPGHGRTSVDSHSELPVVLATREELETDLAPFRAAVDAGVRTVMMAHVSYPALDPTGVPASMSPAIIKLLRNDLGFGGLVATDALIMDSVSASGRSEEEAAVEAVRAGCDVVLYPSSTEDAISALAAALESGRLEQQRVADAVYRIVAAAALTETFADEPVAASSYARALELATGSIRLLRGSQPQTRPGQRMRLHVVDDDVVALPPSIGAPGSALSGRDRLAQALESRGASVIEPPAVEAAVDLIAVFSEVRAWKGRATLAEETIEKVQRLLEQAPGATLVLFGHPRLAKQLPFAANVVCAWCGDPLMQDAVAERLTVTASR
ncbi:MAG: glycoside hydrolase family 3 N-terminal domain-containing protein [Gemmatimonadota bacterium]